MAEFTQDWFQPNNRSMTWRRVIGHLAGQPQLKFLEVGSYEGRSALWVLSQFVTHPTAHLTCLDAWKGGFNPQHDDAKMRAIEARFDTNLAPHRERYTKLKADSVPGMARLLATGQKFDVVYVDACHEPAQATGDMVLAYHLLVTGGYLIIDDYASNHPNHAGLKEAVDIWLKEWGNKVTVVGRGYQVIVRKGRKKVEPAKTMNPVFYCQVYRDPERLEWCLENFRACYPGARCYIISDGDDASPWEDITARFGCEYYPGERLKLLEHGGAMLQRNLEIFRTAPGSHLIKFDTDSAFHRPFNELPGEFGVYGTIQFAASAAPRPKRRSIQGGCYIWTEAAVATLLDSRVLLDSCWGNPANWGGDVGSTAKYVQRTGLIAEDWVLGAACPMAGVPMREFDEVRCFWKIAPNCGPDGFRYAVTHPHKDRPKIGAGRKHLDRSSQHR